MNQPTSETLRPPTSLKLPLETRPLLAPPEVSFLSGTWHVTHSTLPMWKTKRNVSITYEPLPAAASGAQRLKDLVTYQTQTSDKVQTVHGVDTAVASLAEEGNWVWKWRGSGWLMIASSNWEVLGYGVSPEAEEWAVTYFEKTLFTPTGIDIYSRSKKGLSNGLFGRIQGALKAIDDPGFKKLVDELFEVAKDSA
ncbi:hypothetical protein ONZ45_g6750 [Pleurotus djamor]|nr:hypothetical protein ONZ45_g6750 [Pleurotus djamor]